MTENRNEKLLNGALHYIAAHTPSEEAYRFLHGQMGITNEELMQYGLDGLRGHFQYEWEEGTLWREFAEQMDRLLRGLMCIPPLRGSPLPVSWRRG